MCPKHALHKTQDAPPEQPRCGRSAGAAHSPEAVLHDAVAAVPPAGAGVVALEQQGRLRHVELRQQPAILGTDMQSVPASTDTTRFYTEHWPTRGLRQTGPGGAEGGNPTSRRHHARLKDAGSSPGLSTPAPCPRAAGNSPGGRALTAGPSAVLTLSYQQRMLSWPHMQLLEEQSSMQTQYWGGGGQGHARLPPAHSPHRADGSGLPRASASHAH